MDYDKISAQKELFTHLTQFEMECFNNFFKLLNNALLKLNDMESGLRCEDIGKARGELFEKGQLLKNHNNRRNEHQLSLKLRQPMEQLENQVKQFSTMEDMR